MYLMLHNYNSIEAARLHVYTKSFG